MPRPPQNVRIARLVAVLALDDEVRESGQLPDLDAVGKQLGLAKASATDIRRHIARRHGVAAPHTRSTRLEPGAPPPPDGLTPAELACYRVLAAATAPVPVAAMYSQAFGYPVDRSSADAGRMHIRHMRDKGVGIARQYGVGYWLAAKEVVE